MICKNCNKDFDVWQYGIICPYCGNETDLKTFNNVNKAVKYLFDMFGIEILKNDRKFLSLINDIIPKLKREKNLFAAMQREHIYISIYDMLNKDDDERNSIILSCRKRLIDNQGLSESSADEAIGYITNVLFMKVYHSNNQNLKNIAIQKNNRNQTKQNSNRFPIKKVTFLKKSKIVRIVVILVGIIVILLLIKIYVLDIVHVNGSGMMPTIWNDDRVIITKLLYEPKQKDIIIFDLQYENRQEYYDNMNLSGNFMDYNHILAGFKKQYRLSRIIALPGQTVNIENGYVYVDGKKITEYYANGNTYGGNTITYPYKVDKGMVFVLSDNRENCKDSRGFGQIPIRSIYGKVQMRIYPFELIEFIN